MTTTSKKMYTLDKRVLPVLVAIGIAAFAIGLIVSPERAWHNLLLHNFYFLAMTIMAALFLAVHGLARANWESAVRPISAAILAYLPVGAILTILMMLGAPSIYHWAASGVMDHDPLLQQKAAFLNLPFFFLRMVVILAAWLLLTRRMIPRPQTDTGADRPFPLQLNMGSSAVFVVLFALTFSIAAIDWIMTLEPHWYSTLFPWYVMASTFVSSVALTAVLAILLRRMGLFPGLTSDHLHVLGKFVFAFSIFWGYLWFSQYMLIWYTNIPEEVGYFLLRSGPWFPLFVLNVIINLGVPFILLPEGNKRREKVFLTVCLIIIAGHWLDFYLMVMPSLMTTGPRLPFLEIAMGIGFAAAFLITFQRAFFRSKSPLPKGEG